MSRTIVISDVHSCRQELEDLLKACQRTKADRVLCVGDLVDRGPDPAGVVDLLMRIEQEQGNCSSVQGNHDERQVRYYDTWVKGGSPTGLVEQRRVCKFKTDAHEYTFTHLKPAHFEWMRQLPLFERLPEHDAVVIHAGCLPDVPLEEQGPGILQHISNIRAPQQTWFGAHGYWSMRNYQSWWQSKSPEDAKFWATWYDGSHGHVIFGHTGSDKPLRFPHATGLDTGCCFGRAMTALVLPDWTFVSVGARRTYYPSGTRTKLFEVAPGQFVYS